MSAPSQDSMRAAAANGGAPDVDKAAPFDSRSAAEYERYLSELLTGYIPSLPFTQFYDDVLVDQMFFGSIEQMRESDCIKLPLEYSISPLAYAEFEINASSQVVAEFYRDQLLYFWSQYAPNIYEEGVCYGWVGSQLKTKKQDGLLVQDKYESFLGTDCDVVVSPVTKLPIGVEFRGLSCGVERVTAFRSDLVNKAFWYSHRARGGLNYGRSDLRSAYRPWRRLTGRDGSEETIDLAAYRSGFGYQKYFYDPANSRVDPSRAAGMVDSSGRTDNLAISRDNASRVKSGSAIHLPHTVDEHGNRKWDMQVEPSHANLAELLEYTKHLEQRCARAIGVPPELFEAAQTGSGYSGRAIPLQAFLTSRQKPLGSFLCQWHEQIGQPLARHNFGPTAWVHCKMLPLIRSYRKSAWDTPGDQGAGQEKPPEQMPVNDQGQGQTEAEE